MSNLVDIKMLRELRDSGLMDEETFASEMRSAGYHPDGNQIVHAEADLKQVEAELDREEIYAKDDAKLDQAQPVARSPVVSEEHATAALSARVNDGTMVVSGGSAPVKPAKAAKADTPAFMGVGGAVPAKAPKKPTDPTKRAARAAAGTTGSFVVAVMGDKIDLGDGLIDVKPLVDSLPKKVGEKAANLVEHITNGKKLSVFTVAALDTLKLKGELSGKTLTDRFMGGVGSKSYSIDTARSQAGQMISLFSKMGIIGTDGKLNKASCVFNTLRA